MLRVIFIVSLFGIIIFPSHAFALSSFEEWKAKKATGELEPVNYDWIVNSQDDKKPISEAFDDALQEIETESDNQLYRNDQYHFRIKFPAGWEVVDGDGENVVKKAVKDGSTVLVLVRDFLDSLPEEEKVSLSQQERLEISSAESNDFTDEEADEYLETLVAVHLESYPGSTVLEKGIRYVDNRKAAYLKVTQIYKIQDRQIEGISVIYHTIHRGKLYQLQGSYPTAPINNEENEPIINASLSTFVFEDWDAPEVIASKEKGSYLMLIQEKRWSEFLVALLLGALFTWGLGLILPILLRFLFLKRQLSSGVAVAVAGIVWIIQTLIASALSEKPSPHPALLAVALVAYFIMRLPGNNESVDKVSIREESTWHSRLTSIAIFLIAPIFWIIVFIADSGDVEKIPILLLVIALTGLAVWVAYKSTLYVIYGSKK